MAVRKVMPLVLLALAACQQSPVPDEDFSAMDIAKPIHVDRLRVQYAASFASGTSDLSYDQAIRLETFLDQAGVRPDDRVFVASPASDALAATRIGRIAALLAQRSVGVVPVAPPTADIAPDSVLVLVDRFVAIPPRCPNWSGPAATGHDNVPAGNFGCADANNLAEMLANPRDLMLSHTLGPAPAEPALDAIGRYRTGQVKPFLASGQQGTPSSAAAGAATGAAMSAAAPAAGAASPGQ